MPDSRRARISAGCAQGGRQRTRRRGLRVEAVTPSERGEGGPRDVTKQELADDHLELERLTGALQAQQHPEASFHEIAPQRRLRCLRAANGPASGSAMARRLENLGLIRRHALDKLLNEGFRVRESRELLASPSPLDTWRKGSRVAALADPQRRGNVHLDEAGTR